VQDREPRELNLKSSVYTAPTIDLGSAISSKRAAGKCQRPPNLSGSTPHEDVGIAKHLSKHQCKIVEIDVDFQLNDIRRIDVGG
jgi:hypothetical protein